MEDFLMFNTLEDGKYPDVYKENYHGHILCRSGEMRFNAVGKSFTAGPGDLVSLCVRKASKTRSW